MVVGAILAMTDDGVIGLGGRIPWHYPLDMRRFAEVTRGSTLVMGRATWSSLPRREGQAVPVLPGRRLVVISSTLGLDFPMVERFRSLPEALGALTGDTWLVGGRRIYEEALCDRLVDVVDVTRVPDIVNEPGVVRIDTAFFANYPTVEHLEHPDGRLSTCRLRR